MNNKDKLQNKFDKYRELVGKADDIRRSIDIQHDKFVFCAHMHNNHPFFSCWERGLGSNDAAEFKIVGEDVFIYNNGRYEIETIQVMQGIIEDWLSN